MMMHIVLLLAIYNLFLALVTKTPNLASSILFKVLPFFLGIGALLYYLKEMGIL